MTVNEPELADKISVGMRGERGHFMSHMQYKERCRLRKAKSHTKGKQKI